MRNEPSARDQAGRLREDVVLHNDDRMPVIGLGTWMLQGDRCAEVVREALAGGYRHIDTAEAYKNEEDIRRGIEAAGVPRRELFLTSKAWRDHLGEEDIVEACEGSLRRLGTEYLDLYLIHWPNKDVPLEETFRGLKRLMDEGKARSVGVSNFSEKWLGDALLAADKYGVPISVNQVEFHPFLYQRSLLDFCVERGVQVVAYSPLARGDVLEDDTIARVGERHGKDAAQVTLRWLLQKGLVVIPKSSSSEHLLDNKDVFDFELSEEDVRAIDGLHDGRRGVDPPFADF